MIYALLVLLKLSSWCFMIVVWLFLVVPWVCLQFVIEVFQKHTHYFAAIICSEYMPFLFDAVYSASLFFIGCLFFGGIGSASEKDVVFGKLLLPS